MLRFRRSRSEDAVDLEWCACSGTLIEHADGEVECTEHHQCAVPLALHQTVVPCTELWAACSCNADDFTGVAELTAA